RGIADAATGFETQPQLAAGDGGVDQVCDVVVHLYGRLLRATHREVNDEVGADHNGVHARQIDMPADQVTGARHRAVAGIVASRCDSSVYQATGTEQPAKAEYTVAAKQLARVEHATRTGYARRAPGSVLAVGVGTVAADRVAVGAIGVGSGAPNATGAAAATLGTVAAVGVATVAADSSAARTAGGVAAITASAAVASGGIPTVAAASVPAVGVPTVSANGVAATAIGCIGDEGVGRAFAAGAAIAGLIWPAA